MVKLIMGLKGSGKTKTLIRMVNEAVKMTSGNVVCVEKGLKLTYDISHQARLVDIEHYGVSGFVAFGGFLCGLMAGNYDITDIFVDATLRIGGRELEEFAKMLDKLLPLAEENNTTLTFTVSCDISELPERIKRYAV